MAENTKKRLIPALNPEDRESQMIAYAVDLAEQQLRDGTASSQVITHYLKLGTTRAMLEAEKLKSEIELNKAKIKGIEMAERNEQLFKEAIDAMRSYQGSPVSEEEDYETL